MISPNSFSHLPEPAEAAPGHGFVATAATTHDSELVRRFNAGDETAFVEIFGRYRDKMFAVALSLLRNHADAEEISQDTFVRAHRGLAQFRGESSLSTWLHRIAVNLARNRYWYFHRRHRQDSNSLDCTLSADSRATFADLIASAAPDPARLAAADEFTVCVNACMEKLSASHREILTLRNRLDHSYEQIGAQLGITLGTVKSRVARAREALRELLAEMYSSAEAKPAARCQWFEPVRPAGSVNGL
jgi:RNA polymerase sigma-70 factor (ECF subfamily)